jgi:phospholipid/cholesterol/gamma-HCH transport system substrate-binding protein
MMSAARVKLLAVLLVLGLLSTACTALGAAERTTITAYFAGTNNLFVGSEVRILGLQVGEVTEIEPVGEVVRVEFFVDGDRELPADVRAELHPTSLLGERFVRLTPTYDSGPTFPDGGEIPLERTSTPVDVDDVLRSFENWLRSLDRDVLANLIDTLADTFAGQGEGLNQLLDQGSESVRVLADSSEDLNALVVEFAELNETLATRDQVIGRTLERFSVVLQTLVEERDQIIASIANLRRLTVELRPLLDDHSDPLLRDLEVLATTLSTVERNLDRVGELIRGGRTLFEGAGRAFEYDTGRIALNNQFGPLPEAVALRVTDRLVGLCLRLGVDECASTEFFEPIIGTILCNEGPSCLENEAILQDYLVHALGSAPPEVLEQLVEEARAAEAEEAPDPEPAPEPEPEPEVTDEPEDPDGLRPPSLPEGGRLPLPDPRLDSTVEDTTRLGLLRFFGGRS